MSTLRNRLTVCLGVSMLFVLLTPTKAIDPRTVTNKSYALFVTVRGSMALVGVRSTNNIETPRHTVKRLRSVLIVFPLSVGEPFPSVPCARARVSITSDTGCQALRQHLSLVCDLSGPIHT